METFIQVLVNGVLQSGVYMITTIGLAIAVGIVTIINLSHGEFLMIGAFIGYMFYQFLGIDPLISIAMAGTIVFFLGVLTYELSLKKVLDAPEINQLILTFGISIFLHNLAKILAGAKTSFSIHPEPSYAKAWNINLIGDAKLGIGISVSKFIIFIIAIAIILVLFYVLKNTKIGKSMRAVEQNRYGANVVGVNVVNTFRIAFGISVALAAAAGTMLSIVVSVNPDMGFGYTLKAFAIIMMAGLGNLKGVLYASLIMGITESVVGTYIPGGTGWSDGVFFLIILIVLIVKPEGLFKK